jgi:hypothetical protein
MADLNNQISSVHPRVPALGLRLVFQPSDDLFPTTSFRTPPLDDSAMRPIRSLQTALRSRICNEGAASFLGHLWPEGPWHISHSSLKDPFLPELQKTRGRSETDHFKHELAKNF